MKSTKIISAVLALSMLTASAASVFAAEPETTGKTNVTITTEVNGNGVKTHYDGENIVTDTYTVPSDKAKPEASPKATEAPEATAEPTTEPDTHSITGPEQNLSDYALYNTPLFRLIKAFVIICVDEHLAEVEAGKQADVKGEAKGEIKDEN